MSILRVALVDDEPPARRKLRRLLETVDGAAVIGEAGSGAEAIALLNEVPPDLLFLDIQMPDIDGFTVLRSIRRSPAMQVIFVTAFDQHAIEAFDVQALDYLLKPVSPSRFRQSVERARRGLAAADFRIDRLLDRLDARDSFASRLLLNIGPKSLFVAVAEIEFAESAGNYVLVHASGQTHQIRSSLEVFASQLDPNRFVRINRSQIVNLERVREVRPWFHGDYKASLTGGAELSWSRRYAPKSRLSRFQSR